MKIRLGLTQSICALAFFFALTANATNVPREPYKVFDTPAAFSNFRMSLFFDQISRDYGDAVKRHGLGGLVKQSGRLQSLQAEMQKGGVGGKTAKREFERIVGKYMTALNSFAREELGHLPLSKHKLSHPKSAGFTPAVTSGMTKSMNQASTVVASMGRDTGFGSKMGSLFRAWAIRLASKGTPAQRANAPEVINNVARVAQNITDAARSSAQFPDPKDKSKTIEVKLNPKYSAKLARTFAMLLRHDAPENLLRQIEEILSLKNPITRRRSINGQNMILEALERNFVKRASKALKLAGVSVPRDAEGVAQAVRENRRIVDAEQLRRAAVDELIERDFAHLPRRLLANIFCGQCLGQGRFRPSARVRRGLTCPINPGRGAPGRTGAPPPPNIGLPGHSTFLFPIQTTGDRWAVLFRWLSSTQNSIIQ